MLTINNIHAAVEDKVILRGLDLHIGPGEVHAIMGPNGSGKSTLANVLAGRPGYATTEGSITYQGEDLLSLSPTERALRGLFLSFQYPVEIPGVMNIAFLKAAYNARRKAQGLSECDAMEFLSVVKNNMKEVGLDQDFIYRSVNADFSGGEKKRNEILQMCVLNPSLIILDEIDSGLDVDALTIIGNAVSRMRDKTRSFIVITHYQRLLDYIQPDFVHILQGGRIVKSGDRTLALTIEESGYGWLDT